MTVLATGLGAVDDIVLVVTLGIAHEAGRRSPGADLATVPVLGAIDGPATTLVVSLVLALVLALVVVPGTVLGVEAVAATVVTHGTVLLLLLSPPPLLCQLHPNRLLLSHPPTTVSSRCSPASSTSSSNSLFLLLHNLCGLISLLPHLVNPPIKLSRRVLREE